MTFFDKYALHNEETHQAIQKEFSNGHSLLFTGVIEGPGLKITTYFTTSGNAYQIYTHKERFYENEITSFIGYV